VSTLVMVVREKRADIAILRSLGSSPRSILAIFMTQGVLIGLTGTAIGVALGLLVASNIDVIVAVLERLLGFRFLEPDVYFISDFPSRISQSDVLRVAGIAVLLAILSPIYPALSGARTQPAAALREE
jgi:lipoprotein-releasing system permease protein